MAKIRTPIRLLEPDEMERIHGAAVTILERVGMEIRHHEALERLEGYGCRVDHDAFRVRFPEDVTESAVARMRTAYADPERLPQRMAVRYSHIRFRTEPHHVYPDFTVSTGGFCCFIYDLAGKRRPAGRADVRDALRLADRLPNIDFTGLPVSDQSVADRLRPTEMAAELVKHTRKLGGIEVFDARDIEYVTRIAEVVAGSKEALRRNPVLVGYAETRSPLCFDENMVEIFMEYVKRGLPQTVDTMPCAGTTAPATLAGCLAQGCAETLSALVLAHSIDEDAIVGVDIIPSHTDMRSGLFRYAGFGRLPYLVGRVQMISEFYGCPSGVHGGKTDACYPGLQAGADKAVTMLMPVLAGAPGIGTVGHLENAVTFSPVQLVIDDALAGGMRHLLRDFAVNDDTLGLDVIAGIGSGGQFLTHDHTLEHYRDEMYHDWLLDCSAWEAAQDGPDQLVARAAARVRDLVATEAEPPLSRDQEDAVDEIVAQARSDL